MSISINGNGTITGYTPTAISGTLTTANMPAGSILQVVNTNKTDLWAVDVNANQTPVGVSALDTTITTLSANSKILVSASIFGEGNHDDHDYGLCWSRGISGSFTNIGLGDSSSNRTSVSSIVSVGYHGSDNDSTPSSTALPPLLDTPNQAAGTAITYRINYIITGGATKYIRGNRSFGDSDSTGYERGASWVTVMEVKA